MMILLVNMLNNTTNFWIMLCNSTHLTGVGTFTVDFHTCVVIQMWTVTSWVLVISDR